jgi:hypothetical protein
MNNLKKKAAVAKYGQMFLDGTNAADLKAAIEADDKKFTPEETTEILEAALEYQPEEKKAKGGDAPAAETKNKIYEEWRVESEYKEVKDEMGTVKGKKLTGFKKITKVRETSITADKAETLNSQSQNTGLRLYLKAE